MEGPYKKLSLVAKERGISVKLMKAAIRRKELKAIRPGGGKHTWHYVTDFQVDEWLKRSAAR